jgi:hypothetical protein
VPVTLEDVDSVVAMADPAARNGAITLLYRALALEAAEVLGAVDVNWPAFGAWASLTAGRLIRGESLPFGLDLGTAQAVGDGNRAIIADVAPRFVRWLDAVRADGPTPRAWDRCSGHPDFVEAPLLREAFEGYHEAAALWTLEPGLRDAVRDKRHAELVLRSDILVAAHEQALADEFVDAAMPLGGVAGLLTTRFVHVLTPDGPVTVSDDVPRPRYLGGARYPAVLERLHDPRLVSLVRSFGQDPGLDAAASDARSWEDYHDRMGYITCFFRAYLREPRYFDLPTDTSPGGPKDLGIPRGVP